MTSIIRLSNTEGLEVGEEMYINDVYKVVILAIGTDHIVIGKG